MFDTIESAVSAIEDRLMKTAAINVSPLGEGAAAAASGSGPNLISGIKDFASGLLGKVKPMYESARDYVAPRAVAVDDWVRKFTDHNDGLRYGLYGAAGLGGLGAIKGLISPDEGRSRTRSALSNAALGALIGGSGGLAAGTLLGENKALEGNATGDKTDKIRDARRVMDSADLTHQRNMQAFNPLPGSQTYVSAKRLINEPSLDNTKALLGDIASPVTDVDPLASSATAFGTQNALRRMRIGRFNHLINNDPGLSLDRTGYGPRNALSNLRHLLSNTAPGFKDVTGQTLSDYVAQGGYRPETTPLTTTSFNKSPQNVMTTANVPSPNGRERVNVSKSMEGLSDNLFGKQEKSLSGKPDKGRLSSLSSMFTGGKPGIVDGPESLRNFVQSAEGQKVIDDAIAKGNGFKLPVTVRLPGSTTGTLLSQITASQLLGKIRNWKSNYDSMVQSRSNLDAAGKELEAAKNIGAGKW